MDKNIIPTEVVAALIWEGSRFLICQRPRHKARGSLWEFVGGKVEPGESKEEALIRECREELSITVQPGEVFMEVTHTYPDLTVHLARPPIGEWIAVRATTYAFGTGTGIAESGLYDASGRFGRGVQSLLIDRQRG